MIDARVAEALGDLQIYRTDQDTVARVFTRLQNVLGLVQITLHAANHAKHATELHVEREGPTRRQDARRWMEQYVHPLSYRVSSVPNETCPAFEFFASRPYKIVFVDHTAKLNHALQGGSGEVLAPRRYE